MINKDNTIGEILKLNENAPQILMEFGMGCVGCPSSSAERLEEACLIHGLSLDDLLEALNK